MAESFIEEVLNCRLCEADLPLGPRPVLQFNPAARILIAGQAPGRRVHETGIAFNDPSGDRLRDWLGIDRDTFYDDSKIAILPMGFCYPGSSKNGDLPPQTACAETWRAGLLSQLAQLQLTLVIGRYAMAYHLPDFNGKLTASVENWQQFWPHSLPMPHPSPRNQRWLKHNPWFEEKVIPALRDRVAAILAQ